jgi:hypothetical protein
MMYGYLRRSTEVNHGAWLPVLYCMAAVWAWGHGRAPTAVPIPPMTIDKHDRYSRKLRKHPNNLSS